MRTLTLNILTILMIVIASACGDGFNSGENYGDILLSPEGMVLTPGEHQGGWGRADCFFCHPYENMHLANTTSVPGIDMNEVRLITASQGIASCATCHGTNGITLFK